LYWVAVKRKDVPLAQRRVLEVMASMACKDCGYAWPGLDLLVDLVGIDKRNIQRHIVTLKALGAITIHAHESGGRGTPVEYVVLAAHVATPAPCEACRKRKRPGRPLPTATHTTTAINGHVPNPAATAANGSPRDGDRFGDLTWWQGDWRSPTMYAYLTAPTPVKGGG
jgi:hypothetical protein